MLKMHSLAAGAVALCLALQEALAAPLLPPNDQDLRRFIALAGRAETLVNQNYCLATELKPHVQSAVLYLENMQKWLALARKDHIGQLKNLVATGVHDSEQAAALQWAISVQEAFLHLSELLLKAASISKTIKDLKERWETDANYKQLAQTDKKKLAGVLKEDFDKLKSGYEAIVTAKEAFTLKLRESPPPDAEQLPGNLGDIAKLLKEKLPKHETLAGDLVEVAKRGKALFDAGKGFADPEEVLANAALFLTAEARFRQSELVRRLQGMKLDVAADEAAWKDNWNEYHRLKVREDVIGEVLQGAFGGYDKASGFSSDGYGLLRLPYDRDPCGVACPSAPKPPQGLAYGGQPFDESGKITYGAALATYTPATTAKYSEAIAGVLQKWIDLVDRDPAWLKLDKSGPNTWTASKYDWAQEVGYQLHPGWTCHGAVLRFQSVGKWNNGMPLTYVKWSSSYPFQFGTAHEYEPFYSDASGFFPPDRGGRWSVELDRTHKPAYLEFVVEAPIDDPCIIGQWVATRTGSFSSSTRGGGTGFQVTIEAGGKQTVDYSGMEPFEAGEDRIFFAGKAVGRITTKDRVAKVESVDEANATLQMLVKGTPEPVIWPLPDWFGPGGLGGTKDNNAYTCKADTITYTGSTHADHRANLQVTLTRAKE